MELENRESRYRFKGGQRAVLLFLGLLMLCLTAFSVWGALQSGQQKSSIAGGSGRFDAYHASESRAYLDFIMLSDSFTASPYGKDQGMFVLFDPYGGMYLACLPADAPYTYEDIYDYTFGVTDDLPEIARVTGYPVAIGEELRDAAIDYLNEVYYDEAYLTAGNFSEELGDYYLDTAHTPDPGTGALVWILLAVASAVLALVFFLLQGKKKRPEGEATMGQRMSGNYSIQLGRRDAMMDAAIDLSRQISSQPRPSSASTDPSSSIPSWSDRGPDWDSSDSPNAPQGQDPWDTGSGNGRAGNTAAGALGALLGALAGGVLWVIIYQLGFIAGLASLASVTLSLSLYQKFSGKLDKKGIFLSVIFSLAAMVLANVIAYVLSICSAWDWEVSPFTVLLRFGEIMSRADAWGGFFGDLVIGILLGAFSTWSVITQSLQDIRRHKRNRR